MPTNSSEPFDGDGSTFEELLEVLKAEPVVQTTEPPRDGRQLNLFDQADAKEVKGGL
jgi:hypothetical protein